MHILVIVQRSLAKMKYTFKKGQQQLASNTISVNVCVFIFVVKYPFFYSLPYVLSNVCIAFFLLSFLSIKYSVVLCGELSKISSPCTMFPFTSIVLLSLLFQFLITNLFFTFSLFSTSLFQFSSPFQPNFLTFSYSRHQQETETRGQREEEQEFLELQRAVRGGSSDSPAPLKEAFLSSGSEEGEGGVAGEGGDYRDLGFQETFIAEGGPGGSWSDPYDPPRTPAGVRGDRRTLLPERGAQGAFHGPHSPRIQLNPGFQSLGPS